MTELNLALHNTSGIERFGLEAAARESSTGAVRVLS